MNEIENNDYITTKKPLTSVGIFLAGYLLMLVFFVLMGGALAGIYGADIMMGGNILFVMFAVQQILTLLVLRWSLEE